MLPDIRVRQRDYLLEISRSLTEELDLDKLLGQILKFAIEMMAGHAGFIALTNAKGSGRWPSLTGCLNLSSISSIAG